MLSRVVLAASTIKTLEKINGKPAEEFWTEVK